jgi:hypothetical protein
MIGPARQLITKWRPIYGWNDPPARRRLYLPHPASKSQVDPVLRLDLSPERMGSKVDYQHPKKARMTRKKLTTDKRFRNAKSGSRRLLNGKAMSSTPGSVLRLRQHRRQYKNGKLCILAEISLWLSSSVFVFVLWEVQIWGLEQHLEAALCFLSCSSPFLVSGSSFLALKTLLSLMSRSQGWLVPLYYLPSSSHEGTRSSSDPEKGGSDGELHARGPLNLNRIHSALSRPSQRFQ